MNPLKEYIQKKIPNKGKRLVEATLDLFKQHHEWNFLRWKSEQEEERRERALKLSRLISLSKIFSQR